jgi:hypothetical protein
MTYAVLAASTVVQRGLKFTKLRFSPNLPASLSLFLGGYSGNLKVLPFLVQPSSRTGLNPHAFDQDLGLG